MKVLYISSLVSDGLFEEFIAKSQTKGYVGQKYHGMFVRGLVGNLEKKDVLVLSHPPISKSFCRFKDEEDGVRYRYVPLFNIPIVKQIISFVYCFFYALYWGFRNIGKEKVIICSIMRIYQYIPIRLASLFYSCKTVTVACDVPWMTTVQVLGASSKLSTKVRLSIWLSKKLCSSFDLYVLLTESMSSVLNPRNKPYIVVEGFCDINMNKSVNSLSGKDKKDVVIYAGGLNKEYGIMQLVEAVKSIKNENIELWLYGTGNLSKRLLAESDKRIKYWGARSNLEVVEAEIKAMLLINPRPTSGEYTKYSFPSKTMEYMVSGTYTLTTKLSGIPDEYFDYCGCIDSSTSEDIARAIDNALNLGREELHARGLKAKRFVLSEKNNMIQIQKVVSFIKQH